MITECPYCKTEFRITEQQLKLADGMVRCGLCHKTFNALAQSQANLEDDEEKPVLEAAELDALLDLIGEGSDEQEGEEGNSSVLP